MQLFLLLCLLKIIFVHLQLASKLARVKDFVSQNWIHYHWVCMLESILWTFHLHILKFAWFQYKIRFSPKIHFFSNLKLLKIVNGNGNKLIIYQSSVYCRGSFLYKKQDGGKYGSALVVLFMEVKKLLIFTNFIWKSAKID